MPDPAPSTETEVPPGLILSELRLLLASRSFANSPRLSQFLKYVVEQTIAGNRERLKEYQIGVDVFGRRATYSTRTDPVVRVEARQLRFRLAHYYGTEGREDELIISLPKGGYGAEFSLRKAQVAAQPTQATAAEIPAAVERVQAQTQPGRKPSRTAYRRLLPVGIAAAAVCVAALWLLFTRGLARPATPSIAVLPFENVSADPANQYLCDGLTDEVTDDLSRLQRLRVIARSSAFQFKGHIGDGRDAGRRLNVANVLKGGIERHGDRLKLVAQLDRVSDGKQLWSNTYDRPISDILSVQSQLVTAVASALKAPIPAPDPLRRSAPDREAHDDFMRGRYEMEQISPDSLSLAEKDFERAIQRDPDYAAAYAALAAAKYNQALARAASNNDADRKSLEQLLQKALDLDPHLPSPHAMIASLAMQFDWDWTRAERELRAAAAAGPSASAESIYGLLLTYRGRFAEADDHLRRAQDLDPLGTVQLNNLSLALVLEKRFAQAREESEKILARYPNMLPTRVGVDLIYVFEGQPSLALQGLRKLEHRFPPALVGEAMAEARAGHRQNALTLVRPFEANYQDGRVPMYWFALVYGLLGDEANTVKWLERSADRREWPVLNIAVHPVFASMENTPRFRALKKRMRLE